MKTLSVLLTFALLVAANKLAAHLKHANALPANATPNSQAFTVASFPRVNTNHETSEEF